MRNIGIPGREKVKRLLRKDAYDDGMEAGRGILMNFQPGAVWCLSLTQIRKN